MRWSALTDADAMPWHTFRHGLPYPLANLLRSLALDTVGHGTERHHASIVRADACAHLETMTRAVIYTRARPWLGRAC